MPVTIEGEFVRHDDGKDYFNMKTVKSFMNFYLHVWPVSIDFHINNNTIFFTKVKSFMDVSHMKINVDNGFFAKVWTNPANLILNYNWKLLKAEMDKDPSKYTSVVRDIIQPILEKVAVQDIHRIDHDNFSN